MSEYVRFSDLGAEAPIPPRGIHSQTLSDTGGVTLVLFAFAAGEALAEHTSARAAMVHILNGEAEISAGADQFTGAAGTWFRMPAGMPHSVHARTPLRMTLTLLPPGG